MLDNNIKHLSFHTWLKKVIAGSNAAVPIVSHLEEPNYGIDVNCPFHAPYPAGICTKCQPGTIVLSQQPFRMVDHVEIAAPRLVDDFLAGWRQSGFQRFGWLLGRYEEYSGVPLGIKAVVEHIYEPPQDGSIDGFELLEDTRASLLLQFLASIGLQVVGMIYTDLIDDGSGTGRVLQRRSEQSFFLSSSEIVFIARQQRLNPCNVVLNSQPKQFSSRFVTVVVSGEADGGIGLKAYQVSDSAVALEKANLIAATTDPSLMMIRSRVGEAEDEPAFTPPVNYTYKNEYGRQVQKSADPFFPVEYLLVTLSEGIPLQPAPFLASPLPFPAPQMHPNDAALAEYLGPVLHLSAEELSKQPLLLNGNFLAFLIEHVAVNESERNALVEAVNNPATRLQFFQSNALWQRIQQRVAEHAAKKADSRDGVQAWECKHCTFVNQTVPIGGECEVCGLPAQ